MMPASYASTYAVAGFTPLSLSTVVSLVNLAWSIRSLDGYLANGREMVNG